MQERDEQIDLVIRKLDEETGQASRAAANNFQRRLEELEKESEREKKALRNSETSWMDKCTQLSKEKEMINERFEKMMRKLDESERKCNEMEIELAESKRSIHTSISKLKKEHSEARFEDVKRQESLEKTILQLERKLEQSSDEHAILLGEERRKRSKELDQVHLRVKQTINRKDDMILQLQEELKISRMQTEHATEMLERQRQELLA
jgi:5-azacytidine-induced protein 1